MRVFWLVMMLLGVNPAIAREPTSNLRVLFHGQASGQAGWTVAGWAGMPNAAKAAENWLLLAGPRYNGEDWSVEFLGGELLIAQEPLPVLDVRLTPPKFWGINTFVNPRWVDVGGKNIIYIFAQANYPVPGEFVRVGVETEDVVLLEEDYSVAPQMVVPLGRMVLTGSYQFHTEGPDQLWARALLNF